MLNENNKIATRSIKILESSTTARKIEITNIDVSDIDYGKVTITDYVYTYVNWHTLRWLDKQYLDPTSIYYNPAGKTFIERVDNLHTTLSFGLWSAGQLPNSAPAVLLKPRQVFKNFAVESAHFFDTNWLKMSFDPTSLEGLYFSAWIPKTYIQSTDPAPEDIKPLSPLVNITNV